ncbi:Conserved_hypothetical protein [Hexamita inflata]|uniref:Uncharacterized protein n=1 Tax=Hexamita inflata TaxID=28002 RepID=A0AA86QZL7_9EUKA|nr:Conserved hypothetical protein [Hexamita inflata]
MADVEAKDDVLKHHFSHSQAKLPPKQIRAYVKNLIDAAHIPPSNTPPSVLVIPGWQHDMDADKGLAASIRAVRDNIEEYDTIVVVGAFYPDMCGMTPPTTSLSAYYGNKVETPVGDFDIDTELRDKIGKSTGQAEKSNITNELIEESTFYDHPFMFLRSLYPEGKTPKTKVLPLLLYATLRDQVQFAAQVLSDKLFKPAANGQYGVAADGKRYLVIIPIQVSEGLSLFQNVYIENILLDLTFKNKVQDFEQWLYYLTGNTGATFSNTIASQILVVRLSALAQKAVPHTKDEDPEWKWRMLEYYTTFDPLMNRSKMITESYRERVPTDEAVFTDEEDSPVGHQIYFSMSLSLENPLYTSTVNKNGKTVVSKMPVPIQNPEPFSRGAMDELMVAAQLSLLGKNYKKLDQFNKHQRELNQAAPYSLRVYVLADKQVKAENVLDKDAKDAENDGTETCTENILIDIMKTNFYPSKNILESIIETAHQLYEEKLSEQMLSKFEADLKKKVKELVKSGQLPKSKLKESDLNLKQNLIVEIQVYHSWEYKELFSLTEARGSFIALWDGKSAICEVPDSKPEIPSIIFFRLAQCALKGGLEPWEWQRGVVHVFDRTRLTRPVYQAKRKDEL